MWLNARSLRLASEGEQEAVAHSREHFDALWTSLIDALRLDPQAGISSVVRGRDVTDWATDAINAPVGILAQVIFNDPDLPSERRSLPQWWLNRAQELLALPGDMHRHALVIFTHNLTWFNYREPLWTERHLLPEMNGVNKDAFWSGFFGATGFRNQNSTRG